MTYEPENGWNPKELWLITWRKSNLEQLYDSMEFVIRCIYDSMRVWNPDIYFASYKHLYIPELEYEPQVNWNPNAKCETIIAWNPTITCKSLYPRNPAQLYEFCWTKMSMYSQSCIDIC